MPPGQQAAPSGQIPLPFARSRGLGRQPIDKGATTKVKVRQHYQDRADAAAELARKRERRALERSRELMAAAERRMREEKEG